MSVFLCGGGWDDDRAEAMFGGFLAAAAAYAGREPRVLVVLMGTDEEAVAYHARYERTLDLLGGHSRTLARLREGSAWDAAGLEDHDALLVGGGPTPEYHRALSPSYAAIRERVAEGMPYAGFSAGAAIAATQAIVGGWLLHGVPVCPEDSGEELGELEVVAGIGLVDGAVEVHAGAWGTLSRLVAAVDAGLAPHGVALDECTTWEARRDRVTGAGRVWWATPAVDGVVVRRAPR